MSLEDIQNITHGAMILAAGVASILAYPILTDIISQVMEHRSQKKYIIKHLHPQAVHPDNNPFYTGDHHGKMMYEQGDDGFYRSFFSKKNSDGLSVIIQIEQQEGGLAYPNLAEHAVPLHDVLPTAEKRSRKVRPIDYKDVNADGKLETTTFRREEPSVERLIEKHEGRFIIKKLPT